MNFRLALLPLSMSIVAAAFFACGGDSGTSSKSENNASLQAETQDDLPNCSKSREGEIAEVLSEKKAYVCDNGRWEFDHNILDSVKTENDLKACLSKNEGDSVWVIKDEAIYVCTDRKWEIQKKEESSDDSIPEYESEDDLPNCTKDRRGSIAMLDSAVWLCNDGKWQELGDAVETADSLPNCTKSRNGETVYVIDDGTALVCEDGKWTEDEETNEVIEENKKDDAKSSSSKSNKDSDDNEESSDSSDKDDPSSSSSKGSSSASDDDLPTVDKGSIKDSRDGHTYKTVNIGNQVWFAENLNYDDKKSVCPMKDEKYCDKYGRLYKFFAERLTDSTASSLADVCPSGWHIPDSLDWEELFAYVKANNDGEAIGVSLKSRSGWYAEGDSVFIEGDEGKGGRLGSVDSTRFGATRGTNRFGFSALPAGSCWETGCYVDDDTRFVAQPFLSDRGGTFKLALDKDDILYDEDGYFGYTSVRCLQNAVVKIDSMPPVVAIDSLLWMAEDLTHNGSNQFTLREFEFACPSGWRLPTEKELQKAADANKLSLPFEKSLEFFVSDSYSQGASVNCHNYSNGAYCTVVPSSFPNNKTTRAIRCVNDAFSSTIGKFSCSASEYDEEAGSATWTISQETEGSYKIAKYTWDFGKYTKDAKLSDNKATLKFSDAMRITPTATVNGTVEHNGETYQMDLTLSCPTVMAPPDAELVFTAEQKVDLYSGAKYTAYYEGCNNEYVDAHLSCNGTGDMATVTIEGGGKTYTIKGSYAILGEFKCDSDKHFTIEVSQDMPCEVQ